jgi:hypothetical protein
MVIFYGFFCIFLIFKDLSRKFPSAPKAAPVKLDVILTKCYNNSSFYFNPKYYTFYSAIFDLAQGLGLPT